MSFGAYKKDRKLPHPPISIPVFLVLEDALREAWKSLKAKSPKQIDLSNAIENKITLAFQEELFDEVYRSGAIPGFDESTFTVVSRGASIRNFDGTLPDKMPDLVVNLVGRKEVYRNTQDGIFIECKPVDKKHSLGKHYAAKGIIRFVKGEYAWSLTEALMVGHNSQSYTIDPHLKDGLVGRETLLETLEPPKICSLSKCHDGNYTHVTKHNRSFTYLETGQSAPPITIRHLWLCKD